MNRRNFVGRSAAAIPLLALGGSRLWAAQATPRVEESNPIAQALSYVHDATTSPKRTSEQEDQFCDNCLHYGASEEEEDWGTCALIPGYLVAAKGWCAVWVAKPT